MFTLIQLLALGALWILKANPTFGILFPVLIALLVPFRLSLTRWYSEDELAALDAEEEVEEVEQDMFAADAHS